MTATATEASPVDQLVAAVRTGDRGGVQSLITAFQAPLAAVAARLEFPKPPEAAKKALELAVEAVAGNDIGALDVPGLEVPVPAAEWASGNAATYGAIALAILAAQSGKDVVAIGIEGTTCTAAETVSLRLIDVEGATYGEAAGLLGITPMQMDVLYRSGRQKAELEEPSRPLCATWPAVRTMHQLEGQDRFALIRHVNTCTACKRGAGEMRRVRRWLIRRMPQGVAAGSILAGVSSASPAFALPGLGAGVLASKAAVATGAAALTAGSLGFLTTIDEPLPIVDVQPAVTVAETVDTTETSSLPAPSEAPETADAPASDPVSDTAEDVVDAVTDTVEGVADTVDDVVDAVEDAVDDATDAVDDIVDSVPLDAAAGVGLQ